MGRRFRWDRSRPGWRLVAMDRPLYVANGNDTFSRDQHQDPHGFRHDDARFDRRKPTITPCRCVLMAGWLLPIWPTRLCAWSLSTRQHRTGCARQSQCGQCEPHDGRDQRSNQYQGLGRRLADLQRRRGADQGIADLRSGHGNLHLHADPSCARRRGPRPRPRTSSPFAPPTHTAHTKTPRQSPCQSRQRRRLGPSHRPTPRSLWVCIPVTWCSAATTPTWRTTQAATCR